MTSRSVTATLLGLFILAVLADSACEPQGLRVGSETNFLTRCEDACEDGLRCVCGVCTRPCSGKDECTDLAAGAACVTPASDGAACVSEAEGDFCDLPCSGDGACSALGEAFQCDGGYCRLPVLGGEDTPCLATTLQPGDNDRAVVIGELTRRFVVRLPEDVDEKSPVPLLLDFHTLGGSPAEQAESSGFAELADREGFIVAWPSGVDNAWNIGPCCTSDRSVDDVAFVRVVVDRIQAEACVDRRRVYAAGVANGGGMAYELACNAADVLAGIAPSGFDLLVESQQPCEPSRPVTVIAFRGTADEIVPYEGGDYQAPSDPDVTMSFLGAVGTFERWAELNGCAGAPSTPDDNGCATYSDCAEGAAVTLCTTEGGGMDWADPEMAWEALKDHALP